MVINNVKNIGLNDYQKFYKRAFDLFVSIIALPSLSWLIFIAWIIASFDTRSNGFFIQPRVGRNGKIFNLIKIKTMRPNFKIDTTVTSLGDPRITKLGSFFRKFKIDELPQLWHVLIGDMSFVGPRPDVSGFADLLKGHEKIMLSIRPGITGPASLKYRNEEKLLSMQSQPVNFNRNIIWPDKVKININYIKYWSLYGDIKYLLRTIFPNE